MSISDRYSKILFVLIPTTMLLFFLSPIGRADQMAVNVNANNYNIVDHDAEQIIEMDDFDYLMVPGKPLLPAKHYLIALPPGAIVESVDIAGFNKTELEGTYSIKPTPPVIPLSDPSLFPEEHQQLKQKYLQNQETVYKSNNPYPAIRGKLTGKGTLRKYSYVSVAFYPFDYYPQSGQLTLYQSAEIRINYSLPSPGSEEFTRTELLKHDTVADQRASRLFLNYLDIEQLYQPGESSMAVPLEDHDYVIITTEQLYDAIVSTGFVPWKSSLGYDLKIVFTSDDEIASQPGDDLAQRIRNFLRDYYVSWGIEYVLIVGDCASIPMRYCYPDPYNHTYYPYDPFNFGGEVPTDYYYADLSYTDTESWDSDGDGFYGEYEEDTPDFLAEVYVGRIPTNVPGRIEYTLNKITAFEQDRGTWKDNALHGGTILFFANQNYSGYPKVDGADYMCHIENDLMPGWTIDHYAEKQGLEISDYDWPAVSEDVFIDSWRNGQYAVVNWAGHGAANGVVRSVWAWDDGDGVPESPEINMPYLINMDSNLDDDYPSIVFALSCLVGYPEQNSYGRLGVDLLTKPPFGSSIGVLSATRGAAVSADWPDRPGGAGQYMYEIDNLIIGNPAGPYELGAALYDAKFFSHTNYGWDYWYYEYKNLYDYNLYGDPTLIREGRSGGLLDCDLNILSSRVPSSGGDIIFDLRIVNTGTTTYENGLFSELYPVIGDCASGSAFDYNLKKRLTTASFSPGDVFEGNFIFHVDSVAGDFNQASIDIAVGPSDDIWECLCCDEFMFYRPWGSSNSNPDFYPGEWVRRNGERESVLPSATTLHSNYPNPFNAATVIPFDLATDGNVSIRVYNLAGQLVETLAEGYMNAGSHEIIWDASVISSGIYFYVLKTDSFTSTRKMSLLK